MNCVKYLRFAFAVSVSSLASLSSGVVHADLIPIVNAEFEDPALAENEYTWDFIPGWSGVNSQGGGLPEYGVSNLIPSIVPGEAPEGLNVGYLVNQGQMFQTLASALVEGTYVLSVLVGDQADSTYTAPYDVQLRAGSSILGQTSGLVPEGTFVLATVNYTALANDPLLGQPLEIRFQATGFNRYQQPVFDDVQLEFTAVPEPTVFALFATGLVSLDLCARRRKQKPAACGTGQSEPPIK